MRFGHELETVEGLTKQAAEAEKAGFPHGVSTKIVDKVKGSDLKHKNALFNDVSKFLRSLKRKKKQITSL